MTGIELVFVVVWTVKSWVPLPCPEGLSEAKKCGYTARVDKFKTFKTRKAAYDFVNQSEGTMWWDYMLFESTRPVNSLSDLAVKGPYVTHY